MSGKTEKKLRRVCRTEYQLQAQKLQEKAVNSWIANLLTSPFKNRLKVALKIIKGAR